MTNITDAKIHLRELQEKDSQYMLEWMHDEDIQQAFVKNMGASTLETVKTFISANSNLPKKEKLDISFNGASLHFAVVNDDDEYLGTISLKNINLANNDAEYAISMRRHVQGTGVAKEATEQLLSLAFDKYKLHRVYLNVMDKNVRANKFYKKCRFVFEGKFRQALRKGDKFMDLNWYSMLDSDYMMRGGA